MEMSDTETSKKNCCRSAKGVDLHFCGFLTSSSFVHISWLISRAGQNID